MFNITCKYFDLPCSVHAFVKKNSDDTYTIILNSKDCREKQIQSYLHELQHIKNNDFEKDNIQSIEYQNHMSQKNIKWETATELCF